MTPEQITVPKQTWDALIEALERMLGLWDRTREAGALPLDYVRCKAALTAAKALSHQKPETTPAPEGGAITSENDDADMLTVAYMDGFDAGKKSMQPLGWYCVSRDGLATQCADRDDALQCAKLGALDWPNSAPYRAVQLCEYTHPQASEPAGWTGKTDIDAALIMLDRLDVRGEGDDARVDEISRTLRKLAAAPEAK